MQLQVVTAGETEVSATITELYCPAVLGETGVLGDHKPYISLLEPGELNYVDIDGKRSYMFIRDGFIEVLDNKISIVSDSVETGESLDPEAVAAKVSELDARIKSSLKGEITADELSAALVEQKEFQVKQKILDKMAAK